MGAFVTAVQLSLAYRLVEAVLGIGTAVAVSFVPSLLKADRIVSLDSGRTES